MTRRRRRKLSPRQRAAIKRHHDAQQMRQLGLALRARMQEMGEHRQLPERRPEQIEVVSPDLVLARPPRMPVYTANRAEPYHVEPIEVYRSFDDALDRVHNRELLHELREHRTGRSNLGLGLAIGLSIVAVAGLGILLCYVLFRKRDDQPLGSPPMPVPMPYPYPVPQFGQVPQAMQQAQTAAAAINPAAEILKHFKQASKEVGTYMKSFTLPFIGNVRSQPIRIATAGQEPYEVVVRAVEPPGGHAVLSFEPNELNPGPLGTVSSLSTNFSQFPVGDVMIVPVGQFQIVRMRPKQGLFAKGTVAPGGSEGVNGVIVSVSGADFTVGF